MDITQIYAIATGALFGLFLIIRTTFFVFKFFQHCNILLVKHFLFPFIIKRHYFLGPWTRAQLFSALFYLALNIFCCMFGVSSINTIGSRAGTLSVINIIPAYFGYHLSFIGDILGVSLQTYRYLHALIGVMAFALGLFHVFVSVASINNLIIFSTSGQLFGFIAIVSFCILCLQSLRILRLPSYEFFLRCHQALALAVIYSLWMHTVSGTKFPGLYIIISIGIFVTTSILQLSMILYRNLSLNRGFTQILISRHRNAVRMTINVPRALDIRAGQYVNIWIPSISFWSFLQSHPFVIASWTVQDKVTCLNLLVEPRQGLTQKIFSRAEQHEEHIYTSDQETFHEPVERSNERVILPKFGYKSYKDEPKSSDYRLAVFSGPHGIGISIGNYGKVLMVATGFGIAAQLPYLKELINSFNNYQVRTREVRLIWQIDKYNDRKLASDLIDQILRQDINTNGYIMRIEVYYRLRSEGDPIDDPKIVGRHGRVIYKKRDMNLAGLLDDQLLLPGVDGKDMMLVTISANEQVRDKLHSLIRSRLDKIKLLELEFQPTENRQV